MVATQSRFIKTWNTIISSVPPAVISRLVDHHSASQVVGGIENIMHCNETARPGRGFDLRIVQEVEVDESSFDFFQDHSSNFLEMALRTDRMGQMRVPDGYGKRIGDCGDTVELFLQVEQRIVRKISFVADGCINTTACCNAVAHLVEKRSVEAAWDVSPDDVADYLETLPVDHKHCAELSVGALYLALLNYGENIRSPWKRIYESRSGL